MLFKSKVLCKIMGDHVKKKSTTAFKIQQERRCTYSITLRCICETIVAVENH